MKYGRPTKLTQELQEAICEHILKGNFPEVAAAAEGLGKATFYEWIQRGKGKHPNRDAADEYVIFAEAIERARARAEVDYVTRLHDIATSQAEFEGMGASANAKGEENRMRCMQWMLEHGFSQKWGARPELTVGAPEAAADGKVRIELTYHKDLEPVEAGDDSE